MLCYINIILAKCARMCFVKTGVGGLALW